MADTKYMTTDLSDAYEGKARLRYLPPTYRDFGGRTRFHGRAKTLVTFEDNTKLRAAVEMAGESRVLVVDGGGSMNCALFGGNLAALAAENGWAGVIINGCVRDRAELAGENVGIKALASHPRKSQKRGLGSFDVALRFSGVTVHPDDWIYADEDGVIISDTELTS
ncbi:MAG: ribonuclease E activity regulator RraA [PS1 clade bacterium]|uniref:4-hydroxy-4-methyl-2-oxoglutarate aldolase n=1 Tax=PS1 clade bacterium TaxID=2175152 RepID=A0A937L5D0_9PROT|nr:ribonuclease E activity regulator RraA [PS1 clade bacterium]MBL6761787.1 ribonuclease E activity regulator RraA [PS1 clade bacterium]